MTRSTQAFSGRGTDVSSPSSNASGSSDAAGIPDAADVVVIGDGLIGLSTALEVARAGASCCVIGARRPGVASFAAAGLLSPSIRSDLSDAAQRFYLASLARYPAFLQPLKELDPGLRLFEGLLEVLAEPAPSSQEGWLARNEVRALEPGVAAPHGAILHPRDASVDNERLARALRTAVEGQRDVVVTTNDPAVAIHVGSARAVVQTASGKRIEAATIVLAAGAWAASIRGLPRPLPVRPLKGQMLAFGSTDLKHPVMAEDIYLVPRERETLAGATVEEAGFDTTVSAEAIEGLRRAAVSVAPVLDAAPITRTWAGVRPATPDLLPIIGPDPDVPGLLYACGHSKNGILLAPQTAATIAELAQGIRPELDLTPFSIGRF